jgi:hypothetical protein
MSSESQNLESELIAIINTLDDLSWRDREKEEDRAITLVKKISSEDALAWLMSSEKFDLMKSHYTGRSWWARSFLSRVRGEMILKNLSNADLILKKSTCNDVRLKILSEGYYSDVKLIDYVAKRSSGDLLLFCAKICSTRTLKKIKDAKNKELMSIVYERLGPVECLDDMIDDKYAKNRRLGYQYAPFGYEKLNEKTSEIARGPTYFLIKKISKEYLPMLLANRNLEQGSWISKAMQERMDSEV